MKWHDFLSSGRINAESEQDIIKSPHYFLDFNYILLSRMVRVLQEKSFLYPLRTKNIVRTQYSCEVETVAYSRLITHKAFKLMDENGRQDSPDKITRSHICDLLLCAGMLKDVGGSPFGKVGEAAIREWFRNNLKTIKYNDRPLCECLNDQMLEDFYEFTGNARSLRRIVKYSDSDMKLTYSVLGTLQHTYSRYSRKVGLYSERELADVIKSKLSHSVNKHPLSFILEAASYVVEITSAIEDAAEADNLISRRILRMLRSEENFDERTESGEYQKFASSVNYLSKCWLELRFDPLVESESGIIHKWISCVRNEISDCIAQSFYKNYDLIMSGKYNGSLIDDSWCRIFKNSFDSIEKKMIVTSEKFVGIEVKVSKIIDFLLDSLVKSVIYYDTADYNSTNFKNLMHVIPERYITVYKKESKGKEDYERLYLRLMMVIDYICDLTDVQAEFIYRRVNGMI